MATFVAIQYDAADKADEVRKKLVELQRDYLIDLADAVVAVKDSDGKIRLHQPINMTAAGAVSGGFWGTLIHPLFGPILTVPQKYSARNTIVTVVSHLSHALKIARSTQRFVSLLLFVCVADATATENWPQFRGPNADSVATDNANLPTQWNATDNVKWVADITGWGWSCPVVWDGRVFLTAVISDEDNTEPAKGLYAGRGVREPAAGTHHWMVYCFDLETGEQLWKQEAHTGRPTVPRHPKSTYGSETPATDGKRLYVLFGDLGLFCYDLEGKPLWSQAIEPKETFFDYGAAASPVVHDGQVIVVYDNLEESWIAAFDAESGQQNWRTSRDEKRSWATPFVWQNDLRTEIVVPGKNRNRSYSLAGELLWEFDGNMSNLVIPSPFAAHGMCYLASGYVGDNHRPTFAVKPGAEGDITPEDDDFAASPYIEWYQPRAAPYNTSQIVYGDYFYTLYDQGFLTCHHAKTGEQVYGKRRFSPGGSFTSSPWAYNGYLFCLSEDGLTYVLKAGPEFKILFTNDLDELSIATPATVGDKLLIRTASKLYCISGNEPISDSTQTAASSTPQIDLWTAVQEGNRAAVLQHLEISESAIDDRDPQYGLTTLNTAILFAQPEIAKLLIDKGADVNRPSRDGNSPLHVAAFRADADTVARLLERDADPAAKNGQGQTALDVVASDWNPQLVGLYNLVSNMMDVEFDLEQIKAARPAVAALLRGDQEEQTSEADESPMTLERVKQKLRKAIATEEVAGAAHLVMQDGEPVYFEVCGNRDDEDQLPLERDTIVRIYSMTKPITSVTAMLLYEQGKFDLDDPVAKYLPEFADSTVYEQEGDEAKIVAPKRPITVRDTFCHTTGYGYGGGGIPELDERFNEAELRYRPPHGMLPPDMTIAEAARRLAQIPALHHPGERFTYGYSTDLLGRLIEVWSGMPLDEYMKSALLDPLQMVDTGFSVTSDKRDRFGSCHVLQNGKLQIADKAASSAYHEGFRFLAGGSGLVSTIDDYANFCQMLVDGGQFQGARIMNEDTVQLMFTDQLNGASGDFRFGLGFAIGEVTIGSGDQKRRVEQYSWGGYASTDFRVVPDEKVFQVFMRQRVPSSHDLANRLFPLVYRSLTPQSVR